MTRSARERESKCGGWREGAGKKIITQIKQKLNANLLAKSDVIRNPGCVMRSPGCVIRNPGRALRNPGQTGKWKK